MNAESKKNSLGSEYFDAVYEAHDDPWNFASSDYEATKYAATIEALPHPVYHTAFEIGCSIGVLTAQLAARCDSLLAIDVSEKALDQARQGCAGMANVEFRLMQIPGDFPEKRFDLILISEVGYYLSQEDWKTAFEKTLSHLNQKGTVILVHWLPPVHDYPQTGDEVHDSFAGWSENKLRLVKNLRTEKYRLDVWEKI